MKPMLRRLEKLEAEAPGYDYIKYLTDNQITARLIELYLQIVKITDATAERADRLRAIREYVLAAPETVEWEMPGPAKRLAEMTKADLAEYNEAWIQAVLAINPEGET